MRFKKQEELYNSFMERLERRFAPRERTNGRLVAIETKVFGVQSIDDVLVGPIFHTLMPQLRSYPVDEKIKAIEEYLGIFYEKTAPSKLIATKIKKHGTRPSNKTTGR